jgi:hypothetical protein
MVASDRSGLAFAVRALRGLNGAPDQRYEQVRIEAPTAMDSMRAAIDEPAMAERRIFRRVPTENPDFKPRGGLEPGACG